MSTHLILDNVNVLDVLKCTVPDVIEDTKETISDLHDQIIAMCCSGSQRGMSASTRMRMTRDTVRVVRNVLEELRRAEIKLHLCEVAQMDPESARDG